MNILQLKEKILTVDVINAKELGRLTYIFDIDNKVIYIFFIKYEYK